MEQAGKSRTLPDLLHNPFLHRKWKVVSRFHHPQKKLITAGMALGLLYAPGTFSESTSYNHIQKQNSQTLPALLQDPTIAPRYEKCQEYQNKNWQDEEFDMGKCIWDGGWSGLQPLSDGDREKIQKMIQGIAKADITTTQISGNPALKKLEEYYAKRLKEIINPEGEQKKVLADHTIYNKIYRSQLGKNVISALSSYCIDADGDNSYLVDKKTTEKTRKNNLKKLAKHVETTDQATSNAYAHWSNCASLIKDICHDTCPEKSEEKNYCCGERCPQGTDPFKHSQSRACEVVDYISAVRQNLLSLDKIDEGWKNRTASGFGTDMATDIDTEKITNLSSKEVVEKSGYAKEQQKILDEMKECRENFDPEKCQKFVGERKKENTALMDEYGLRTKVLQEKINKIADPANNNDSLEKYLKEEGYTDEQIAEMLEEENGKKLKQQIAHQFSQKRKALMLSLKEKINKTQTEADDSEQAKKKKLMELEKEAEWEQQRLGELVFFTNMISGFLKIGDEEGNILGTNSEAMMQELKDSVFSSEDDFEAVKKIGEKMDSTPGSSPNTQESRNLDVQTINEVLLNYD